MGSALQVPLSSPQLHIHILGQPTAGQQQSFAHVIADLLADLAIHAHAFCSVQQLK